MTIKEEVEQQKLKCAKMLGGKCRVCKCTASKRGMVIHHYWYVDNDVIYSNYPQNDSGRLQYYKDLEPMIKANPKRFAYYCNTDHHNVTAFSRFGDEKFNTLCLERKRSRKT
jgi:hypothetical protein